MKKIAVVVSILLALSAQAKAETGTGTGLTLGTFVGARSIKVFRGRIQNSFLELDRSLLGLGIFYRLVNHEFGCNFSLGGGLDIYGQDERESLEAGVYYTWYSGTFWEEYRLLAGLRAYGGYLSSYGTSLLTFGLQPRVGLEMGNGIVRARPFIFLKAAFGEGHSGDGHRMVGFGAGLEMVFLL